MTLIVRHHVPLLLLLLLVSPLDARKSGGGGGMFGGGGSRGSSAARGNVQQGGGGWQGQQQRPGNFQPQPQPHPNQNFNRGGGGGFAGGAPAGGFHNTGGFRPGTGPGSASRASTFKHALAGAALGTVGGLLAFEAGKAIINSASSPFHVGNKPYYWGDEHYQRKSGEFMCSMPLSELQAATVAPATTPAPSTASPDGSTPAPAATTPSPDTILNNVQFKDGTRPKTVTWGCKAGAEVCCGSECCPAPPPQNQSNGASGSRGVSVTSIILGIILFLLLISCCFCCIAYLMCRSVFDCIKPQREEDHVQYHAGGDPKYDDYGPQSDYSQQQHYGGQQAYPQQGYPPQQQHGYPAQPYPAQAYPQQGGGYPNQPFAAPGYPSQHNY